MQHVDLDRRLHVLARGEHIGAPGRDGGVALDEPRHYAALGLDAERQRRDIEEQHRPLTSPLALPAWMARADGDDLIGVDAPCWLPCR